MKKYIERFSNRCPCKASIIYTGYDTEKHHDAIMKNVSEDGMYFESDYKLAPDSDIYIKIQDKCSYEPQNQNYQMLRAKVKWCKEIDVSEGESISYGIGVQYMVNSHINMRESEYVCDLCGKCFAYRHIYRTDEIVHTCSECFHSLKNLKENKIKQSISNFLSGNVL